MRVEERYETMIGRLRAAGHRLTPQRRAIVRALVSGPSHPGVDELFGAVVGAEPGIGLATVYNTLELLDGLGELMVLDFGEGRRRYDARRPQPHVHVICVACGRVDDVDGVEVNELPTRVAERTGYRLLEHRFDLRGLCPACQTGTAGNP